MDEARRFYRSAEEWMAIPERLKQTPCPHCKGVGALVLHGFLRGYDESSPRQKTVRARRIFCSNRYARSGCGRTFSVWLDDKIRRLRLTADALWQFLQLAVATSILAASRDIDYCLSDRTWQRFHRAQSTIRTALCGRRPPRSPTKPSRLAAAQVLAHLQAVFPDVHCPIAAFQHSMQTFFV